MPAPDEMPAIYPFRECVDMDSMIVRPSKIVGGIAGCCALVQGHCVAGFVEYAAAVVPLASIVGGDVAVGQR